MTTFYIFGVNALYIYFYIILLLDEELDIAQ